MRACLKYLKDKGLKQLDMVEVGVHNGNNAVEMYRELDVKRFYLIDPYRAYVDKDSSCQSWFIYDSMLVDNLRKVAEGNMAQMPSPEKIKFIRLPSLLAVNLFPDQSLDFVYIDASHSRPDVDNDIIAWYPKVKVGGVLGGHDWGIGDVKGAVYGFAEGNKLTLQEELFETDWFIQK